MLKYGVAIKSKDAAEDHRVCTLCNEIGDGEVEGPARLLNMDMDVWVHLNCALWSLEVYETLSGALMNVELALKRGLQTVSTLAPLSYPCRVTSEAMRMMRRKFKHLENLVYYLLTFRT